MQQVISDHPDLADVVYDLVLGRAKSLDATVIPLISLALGQLADHQDLPAATVDRIVDMIVDGTVSDGQAGAFLLALRVKGQKPEMRCRRSRSDETGYHTRGGPFASPCGYHQHGG